MKSLGGIAVAALVLIASGMALGEIAMKAEDVVIRTDRPRIWLDEGRLAWLRAKVDGKPLAEIKALAGTSAEGRALVYAMTGDEESGRAAVGAAMEAVERGTRNVEGMVAICYDWCHPLLTEDERREMLGFLVERGRADMDFKRVWRSFHNGLYSASIRLALVGIAVSHDHPFGREAIEYLIPEWEDSMKVFENLFPDGEWPESFDYNRHVTYDALRFYWALKTASGVDYMAGSRHIRNTTLYIIHATKPNGLVLPGDDNDWPHVGEWEREALLMLAAQYSDSYAQYYVNHAWFPHFQTRSGTLWKDLLWYDPDLPEKPFDDLPLSRFFQGDGLVMARSAWGWDGESGPAPATWVTFRCGDYYGDHAHFDNGHFDIYYKGELAIDSGRYDDDWGLERDAEGIKTSQFFNYYQRTIAHNTILVYDPDEKMQMGVVNDGGQKPLLLVDGVRNVPEDYEQGTFPSDDGVGKCDWATNPGRWETGDMLAYFANEHFTYACGDATRSYSDHKMQSFVRHFLFLQPDVVVVFDRVVSTTPEFRKTWLLHSVNEPRFLEENGAFELENGSGRLVCVPVLPTARTMEKVGGPGNEFLVGGVHYATGPDASSGRRTDLHFGEIPGAWRVEECPAEAAKEDYFLNVMLVTDAGGDEVPDVTLVRDDADAFAVTVARDGGQEALITFAKGAAPAAALVLRRGGQVVFEGALPMRVVDRAPDSK